MVVRNRAVALAYRIAAVAVIAVALYESSGLPEGRLRPVMLSYYTIQSALWALALMVANAVVTLRDLRARGTRGTTALPPLPVGAVTLAVTITLLVYRFVLVPQLSAGGSYTPYTPRDLLIHFFTPLSLVVDWLLFVPHGRYRWRDAALWLALPLAYFIFAMARAEIGGPLGGTGSRYPYYFMDLDALGPAGFAASVSVLCAAFALLGLAYVGIDRGLGWLERRSPART